MKDKNFQTYRITVKDNGLYGGNGFNEFTGRFEAFSKQQARIDALGSFTAKLPGCMLGDLTVIECRKL